jgi:SagB-type dehydrogenase family enzyme
MGLADLPAHLIDLTAEGDPLGVALAAHAATDPQRAPVSSSEPRPTPDDVASIRQALGGVVDVPLPEPAALGTADVIQLFAGRRSQRDLTGRPISLDQLAALLRHSAGVNEFRTQYGVGHLYRRPTPSGGGLNSVDVYLLAANVDGLGRGTYRYAPAEHGLVRLGDDDPTWVVGECVQPEEWVYQASAVLVLVANLRRLLWKYGTFSDRLALLDSGALVHALYLTATAVGLGGCALGADGGRELQQVLGLDADQIVTSLFPVGTPPVASRPGDAADR